MRGKVPAFGGRILAVAVAGRQPGSVEEAGATVADGIIHGVPPKKPGRKKGSGDPREAAGEARGEPPVDP
jgi:hypothetical protein